MSEKLLVSLNSGVYLYQAYVLGDGYVLHLTPDYPNPYNNHTLQYRVSSTRLDTHAASQVLQLPYTHSV